MERNIVVINGNTADEMCWQCYVKGEAERMVRWLVDHGISAQAVTLKELITLQLKAKRER